MMVAIAVDSRTRVSVPTLCGGRLELDIPDSYRERLIEKGNAALSRVERNEPGIEGILQREYGAYSRRCQAFDVSEADYLFWSRLYLLLNFSLTETERTTLSFVMSGYHNRAIAAKQYLEEPTVKGHIKNIFRKLDLSPREPWVVQEFSPRVIIGHLASLCWSGRGDRAVA